ncbi:MAG: SO_0444 family Cu/Zn efflux transporter [Rikenellaceae bacterium]
MEYLEELLEILGDMSPYLILGFLISGLLHVYVPKTLYARFLHRKGFGSVLGAAILGIPLPLCSCGVIPTAMSLKKEGASDGATISFLVGTPQTGVDSILATYALLGLPFAIIRPVASLIVAVFSGLFVDRFGSSRKKAAKKASPYSFVGGSAVGLSGVVQPVGASCVQSPLRSQSHSHSHSHSHGGGCCCHSTAAENKGFGAALHYAFVVLMQDFGKWLVIGLLVAAAITAFVPDSAFTVFSDYYFLNILLILLISAPMYICATGSIPIALSLMLIGLSPGAAFVLLMAGPATNFASLIILRREIGMRKTVLYLVSIIVGAVGCALIIDFVLPQEWFSGITSVVGDGCGEVHSHEHSHSMVWWQLACSIVFVALFLNAMLRKWLRR